MIDLHSFFDELEKIKIAAHKCRTGSPGIRPHNLAKKVEYDGTHKITTKLSSVQLAKDILAKKTPLPLKPLGLVGGGALGALTLEQAYKDWSLGRQIRKQQG